MLAGQQGAGLVEIAIRVSRIAHAFNTDSVTAMCDEQSRRVDEVFVARPSDLRDRCAWS